nr:hypothetical protein [Tanacetum cinerariifolium]
MERGFLDNSDKKKKEGGSKVNDVEIPILGNLVKRVMNIEGKTTMPKVILKKVVRNVSSDTHEVVMPLNDVDSVNNLNVADAGKLNANSSSPTSKLNANSSSPTTDIRNLGPGPAGLATNEAIYAPKTGTLFSSVVSLNAKNSAVGSSNAKHGGSNPSVPVDVNMDNSYASLVRPSATTKVHFRTLVNEEKVDNFNCVLPRTAAAKIMK